MLKRFTLACLLLAIAAPAYAQGTIIPFVPLTFVDASGNPVNGGKLCSYAAGSSTPLATYSDVLLMTANANPVIMSANGRPQSGAIYLSPTSYKFVFRTAGTDTTCATGTILWTLDNVAAVPTSSGNVDVTGTAGEALAAGDVVYLSDGSNSLVAGRFYKADADFLYASNQAGMIGIATAAIASGSAGTIRYGGQFSGLSGLTAGMTYYVSATAGALTATAPTNARIVGQAVTTTTIDFASNPRPILTQPLNVAEGRLTAQTGTCVTSSDQSAVTAIYWTPCTGNRIALYDGTTWNERQFAEITISVAACTASKPYDVFLYDNAGTVTAEQLVWTDATNRATALVRQNGVLVKSGALTRRYIGSYYCNASGGQTDDTLAKRYVWSYYNRVARPLGVFPTTDSWTYTTNTWRQANNSTANRLDVMIGVADVEVSADVLVTAANDNAGVIVGVAIGYDSTSAPTAGTLHGKVITPVINYQFQMTSAVRHAPAVGRHVYVWLEISVATGTTTWFGDDAGTKQSGIAGTLSGG